MLIDEIATRLSSTGVNVAQPPGSTSTSPWTLYKWMMREGPDKIVVVRETSGFAPIAGFGLTQPTFQVIVRGPSEQEASTAWQGTRLKIEKARAALHAFTPGTIGGVNYAGIWAEQEPFLIGTDEDNRPEFAINFRALRDST